MIDGIHRYVAIRVVIQYDRPPMLYTLRITSHNYIWDNLSDERTEYENTNRQNQKNIKWLSHGPFECSRKAGPRTLECPRPPQGILIHTWSIYNIYIYMYIYIYMSILYIYIYIN